MLINLKLFKLTKGSRMAIFLCSLCELLLQTLNVILIILVARLVSSIGNKSFIDRLFLPFIVLFLSAPVKILRTRLSTYADNKFINVTRMNVSESLLNAGMPAVINERTGALTTTIISKIQAIAPYYSAYIPSLIGVFFVSTGSLIYIATINVKASITGFFSLLMVILIPYFWYNLMHIRGIKSWAAMSVFRADFLDNIQGMETLKMLKGQEEKKEKLSNKFTEITKRTMAVIGVNSIESAMLIFFAGMGSTIAVGFAVLLSLNGEISSMQLVEILLVSQTAFLPVYGLINTWHLGFNGVTASHTIFDMLNLKRSKFKVSTPTDNSKFFSIKGLSFSYDGKTDVLRDVNMEAKKGEVIALVGRSGSGKSTLINIITGLYPIQQGIVSIDGETLDDNNYIHWRKKISTVWQNPYIFDASFKENICLGDEPTDKCSEERLSMAIKAAGLNDLAQNLPIGLDTSLGEKGQRLSGGERQRVAIARCFYKESDIIIFDEATSNLDEENQSFIGKSLEKLFADRTSILISHRLSTIRTADRIYVLENGVITASGSHEQLMEYSDEYRELVSLQEG